MLQAALISPRKSQEEIQQEVTASLTAAWEPIMDAVMAILSKLDGLFTLKEQQRTALKAFIDGK